MMAAAAGRRHRWNGTRRHEYRSSTPSSRSNNNGKCCIYPAARAGYASRVAEDAFSLLLASLGANVRRARESKGLTQQRLAEIAGISQRYVAGIEAGRESPGLRRLFALAGVLDVTPDALLRPRKLRRRNPGRPRKRS